MAKPTKSKKAMPATSNKGGATRGKDRAAQAKGYGSSRGSSSGRTKRGM